MNEETTVSKVSRLLQKSRQAFRIYSSMSKSAKAEHNEYADMQAVEWRNINSELVRQLTHIVEKYSAKNIALQISRMRDILLSDYRRVESELNSEHREIISCTQRGDFIRVAQLARALISKKAFVQAAQAACHELSLIVDDSQISLSNLHAENQARENKRQQGFLDQIAADPSLKERSGRGDFSLPFNNSVTEARPPSPTSQEQVHFEDESELFPRMAKVIPLRR